MLSTDSGDQPLQTRRQALLRAAARFDGDVGQLLVAFTEQVPQLCSTRQRCLPYTTSQHAFKCLEAEIAELERLMQLPPNDLTVRPTAAPACFCNTSYRRRHLLHVLEST